ncbi:MAG: NADH:flavin oxidoreductase/NADH oxidase [Tepidisphaeraceae bacterium]
MLFSPLMLRSVTLRNRVGMSPMCMFSARRGVANAFHEVHYAARAMGGVGLVVVEATAVEPRGVIAPDDLGIWSDSHIDSLRRVASLVKQFGAVPAIQLAHAGRKAGSFDMEDGSGIDRVGPSAVSFDPKDPLPRALTVAEIDAIVTSFAAAARRAVDAEFKAIELHMAHGYLLHSFLSPISNRRTDDFGGSFENRIRFALRVIDAVRGAIPGGTPLFVRLSCTDAESDGWSIEQSVAFARLVKQHGGDLIDCSSGGVTPRGWLRKSPGYQVPFAARIRREANIATAAVGDITLASHAQQIIDEGSADLVLLGRELLRNPYWALHAMKTLNAPGTDWPRQYRSAQT